MAKRKPEVRMVSYGVYTPFDRAGKDLPRVLEITNRIPVRLGVEFGYILEIRKARGLTLEFTIEHPPFTDDSGQVAPPFTGEVRIPSSDYRFFLGDTFWQPLADKLGDWTLTARIDGQTVADKTFHAEMDESQTQGDA